LAQAILAQAIWLKGQALEGVGTPLAGCHADRRMWLAQWSLKGAALA